MLAFINIILNFMMHYQALDKVIACNEDKKLREILKRNKCYKVVMGNKKVIVNPIERITSRYQMMMIKMKISYMAWVKGVEFFDLFFRAISVTL